MVTDDNDLVTGMEIQLDSVPTKTYFKQLARNNSPLETSHKEFRLVLFKYSTICYFVLELVEFLN